MGRYHRTQILLEDWQYRSLKGLAQRAGVSLSDMLRTIVSRHLRGREARGGGLRAIAGIGRDRRASGREHDRWLYGEDRPG